MLISIFSTVFLHKTYNSVHSRNEEWISEPDGKTVLEWVLDWYW